MKDAAAVFAPDDSKERLPRAGEMADPSTTAQGWWSAYPAVAAMFEEGVVGDCLTVLALPETHPERLTSTSPERSRTGPENPKKRTMVVGISRPVPATTS